MIAHDPVQFHNNMYNHDNWNKQPCKVTGIKHCYKLSLLQVFSEHEAGDLAVTECSYVSSRYVWCRAQFIVDTCLLLKFLCSQRELTIRLGIDTNRSNICRHQLATVRMWMHILGKLVAVTTCSRILYKLNSMVVCFNWHEKTQCYGIVQGHELPFD